MREYDLDEPKWNRKAMRKRFKEGRECPKCKLILSVAQLPDGSYYCANCNKGFS